MKWFHLLLFGQISNAVQCVTNNISVIPVHSTLDWVDKLLALNNKTILEFNPSKGINMNNWIIKHGWAIEEWAKDHKTHFNTFYDNELQKNVLRIDIHRNDGDGSNQNNFNMGNHRSRQELKVNDNSPDIWKIYFGDYIYLSLTFKFDMNFKYNLTHFYHIFQLKPMNDLSHMPVFTISTIKNDMYLSFNTVKTKSDKRPSFNLFKVIDRASIIGKWIHIKVFFHPVRNGYSEILFIVQDLCNNILYKNYLQGKLYQDKVSPYIRPKIGQYHKYSNKLPCVNSIYYENITIKKIYPSKSRKNLVSILHHP